MIIISFLLSFLFLLSFSRPPPGGHPKTPESLHTFRPARPMKRRILPTKQFRISPDRESVRQTPFLRYSLPSNPPFRRPLTSPFCAPNRETRPENKPAGKDPWLKF